jgi:hypothetical protein
MLLYEGAPQIAVETGVWKAKTTQILATLFREVHSIELSEPLYTAAVETCKDLDNVHLYNGDSATVVPELTFDEPVFYFLDAHFMPRNRTKESIPGCFPLWKELNHILTRPHSDIILVDDIHCFGNPRGDAPEWEDVTRESLLDRVREKKEVTKFYDFHDAFVMHV